MADTKQNILLSALRLFAKDGYEAVSVSAIAGELGMTKGALYKHYKNKRDIFDSIVECMRKKDAEKAADFELPVGTADEMPNEYRSASLVNLIDYAKGQFRYWVEDDFASLFRRVLAIEQFRSDDMSQLYHQYLVSGPLGYTADLLSGIGVKNFYEKAAALVGTMFLMYSVYDGAQNKEEVIARLDVCLDGFYEEWKGCQI